MTGLIAAEARKLQKEQASAEKTFKTLSKREVPSMEPEYTDYAHQIMMQIGKPVRRSIQDLQEALARHDGKGNLKDFIEMKQQDFRAIDAWDQLYDTSWRKDYNQLTADEFRAIHTTIKTLVLPLFETQVPKSQTTPKNTKSPQTAHKAPQRRTIFVGTSGRGV